MILSVQVSGVEGFRGVSLGRMFFTCFGEIGDQICDHRTDGGRQESGPPTRHWLLWSRSLRTRTWLRARSCRRWSEPGRAWRLIKPLSHCRRSAHGHTSGFSRRSRHRRGGASTYAATTSPSQPRRLRSRQLAGGYALWNDGPAFASLLAAALQAHNADIQTFRNFRNLATMGRVPRVE